LHGATDVGRDEVVELRERGSEVDHPRVVVEEERSDPVLSSRFSRSLFARSSSCH
jgi:hypothetical protein